jgi:phospholipid transport system substrate-binding protein
VLETFDSEGIGRHVVAPVWGNATPEQRDRFQAVFKKALINTYIERFFDYDGESLKTVGTRAANEGAVIVQSTVATPSGTDRYNLDWLVVSRDGSQKFFDVVIDGVSTTETTAQDYQSVLRNSGGDFDRLIGLLEKKNP